MIGPTLRKKADMKQTLMIDAWWSQVKPSRILHLRPSRRVWVIAFIILASVIVRAPYLGDPAADYDQQLYSVIGQNWLAGELPYRDLWDRKPPGLFALFAAMHAIGGASSLAYEIPGLLCTIAAALMIYSMAQRIGTSLGAVTVTLLFLLNIPLFIIHLGQSETFLMPILLGQLMLLRAVFACDDAEKVHRILCIIALLGGVTLQIKYSVFPFCTLFGVLAAWRLWQLNIFVPRILLNLTLYGFLGLLPTLLFVAYFAAHGELETFMFANFVSIFQRGELDPDLVEDFGGHIAVASFPLLIFAALGWQAALRARDQIDVQLFALTTAFAAAGCVSLLMLGAPFVHYFGPLLPFICLMAASFFSFHPSHKLFAGVAIGLAVVCASFDEQLERTLSHRNAIPALAAAIDAHVPDEDCLFIFDGPTVLYAQTGNCIATRLVFPDHLTSPRERSAMAVDPVDETARVMAERPGAIVISDGLGGPRFIAETGQIVRLAIEQDYVLAETTFLYPRQIELYIRADLAPASPAGRSASPCVIRYGSPCQFFTSLNDQD